MPNIGPLEVGLVLLIVLLLFGAARLPELGRSMGQSIHWFKTGMNEDPPDEKPKESSPTPL